MPRTSRSTPDQPEDDELSLDVEQQPPVPYGPKVGDTIICTSRLPSPLRPWENPIWVGVIEEPGTDPSRWNGRYSEAAYCVHSKKRRVRYRNPDDASDSFVQHDKVDSLIVLSEEEARLTGIEAVRHFLGLVAAHQFEQHQRSQGQDAPPATSA